MKNGGILMEPRPAFALPRGAAPARRAEVSRTRWHLQKQTPLGRLERPHMAPEATAFSTELWGQRAHDADQGVAVGEMGTAVGAPMGITNSCPCRIKLASAIPLASAMASMVVPYFWAIVPSTSPGSTT